MSTVQEPSGVVRGRAPKALGAPHGPAQVVPAAIAAATELFAAQGIAGVSVREISRRAGINPALVPRYIGDKDALISAVLDDLSARIVDQIDHYVNEAQAHVGELPSPPAAMNLYFRIASHLVIEGYDLGEHQPDFPVIRRVVEVIAEEHGVTLAEARRRGAQIFILALGVQLFGGPLLAAARLDPTAADDQADLWGLVHEISEAVASGQIDPP
jgi:TetR/AcrR family transcriptional regulator, repressor for neighboring sulfatase